MRLFALILAFSPILLVDAQDKKPEPKKKPDPKVWMCKRGELLWEEKFAGGAWSKEWNRYKGNFVVEGDAVKSAEIAADGHHPAMSRKLGGDNNVVVQFSFKLDGSPWMGFALDDKEHVARLFLYPDQFKIVKMSGTGGTTKGTDVDTKRLKLDDGQWHTVVWEIVGKEMVATIDDKDMVIGKADDLTPTRSRCELINGGQFAWWKDVKVWKAEVDDKWPNRRAQLLPLLKKKS
ncbi:MAG TPA: hypothetical protein VM222_07905 [Planctomycetota bacterium]|nr:hypothetical protein [Planctomycetota bacterium]